jgi:hypothetical protein
MYYPKSKITENLYTNGSELVVLSTGKPYQGLYHNTFDGNSYTEPTHTNSSVLLSKIITSTIPSKNNTLVTPSLIMNFEYDNITKNRFDFLKKEVLPSPYFPILSERDYTNGYVIRYFTKRSGGNVKDIKEISSEVFSDISTNVLYISVSLSWKLTGPYNDKIINKNNTIYGVHDTNARSVAQAESTLPGITQYLGNLIQFAKINLES